MVLKNVELPMDAITELCHKYGVEELSIFGSVLGDDFRPDSDLDFLVVFKNNDAGPWAGKFMDLEEELRGRLGRSVDLVDKRGIEESPNWIRRQDILESAQVLYAA